jgi:hypothetical protein
MKKTNEQLAAEFENLIAENGFKDSGELGLYGQKVYVRTWTKETEVLWYGKSTSVFEIRVSYACGIPTARVICNGRPEGKMRGYSTPKTAFNALRDVVSYAGYAF